MYGPCTAYGREWDTGVGVNWQQGQSLEFNVAQLPSVSLHFHTNTAELDNPLQLKKQGGELYQTDFTTKPFV